MLNVSKGMLYNLIIWVPFWEDQWDVAISNINTRVSVVSQKRF